MPSQSPSLSMIIYAMSDLRLLQWRGSVKWPVDKPQHFHLLCPTKAARHYPLPTTYPPVHHQYIPQETLKSTDKRGLPKLLSIVSHFVPQATAPPPTTRYNEEDPVRKSLSHRIPATTLYHQFPNTPHKIPFKSTVRNISL